MKRAKDPFIGDYASKEEKYFSWWIEEMMEAGHICSAVYQPKTFELCPKVEAEYTHRKTKQLVTKVKRTVEQRKVVVVNSLSYTPDWMIRFSNEFLSNSSWDSVTVLNPEWPQKKPSFILSNTMWFVDVKGAATRYDDGRYFTAMQKMTLDKHDVYPQRLELSNKIGGFFDKTFTPEKFLTTDKSGKKRSLKYEPTGIKQFLGRYFL